MKPKTTLLLLAAVCIIPPLAATALFFWQPPEGTTNRGELIKPVTLPAGLIAEPQETASTSVWHLIAVGSADCGPACAQRLCMIAQTRLVHIGELPRIRLLWLATGSSPLPQELLHEPACGRELAAGQVDALDPIDVLADVRMVRASSDQLDQLPAPADGHAAQDYIYFADPQERVIMRFGQEAAVKDLSKDLGRLLRLSQRW